MDKVNFKKGKQIDNTNTWTACMLRNDTLVILKMVSLNFMQNKDFWKCQISGQILNQYIIEIYLHIKMMPFEKYNNTAIN